MGSLYPLRVAAVILTAILAVTSPAFAKLEPPVAIALATDEGQLRAGAVIDISGTLTPQVDLGILDLRFETEGAVVVKDADKTRFYNLAAGQPVPFTVTARYLRNGKASVHVWADGADREGRVIWSKRETLYALVRPDRSFAAMGDYLKLERAAIAFDRATNKISAETAATRLRDLSRVPFTHDSRPLPEKEFSAQEKRLNTLIGAPENGYQPNVSAQSQGVHKMDCCITVQGHVDWTDENGNTHPVFGAAVHIRDDDLGPDEDIVAVATDTNGNYSVQVDNDDGFGAGDRDIYVEVHAANSLINTTDSSDTYEMVGPVHDETPTGTTITENFTAANSGGGEAFSVFQAATWIAVYARDKNGGPLPQVEVIWPNGGTGSFYDGDVNIEQADRWDWDTVMHEYGHYIADQLDTEDNPGGPHNLGDCISVTGSHDKSEGVRLAWGEGWPTYNGTVAQQILGLASLNVPRVGDTTYQDLEDGSVVYDLEGEDSVGIGEDNEVAVQRLLFDLFDSANDNRDSISRSDQSIWNTLDAADPTTLSAGWNALRSGVSNQTDLLMGKIASDQTIGPRLIAPAAGAIVSPSNANFSWRADVGCSNSFAGNSFTLKFYNAATFANVLNIPGLSSTSTTLTAGQLSTLVASSHQILWAVEGSNTSSPGTGPYLGENFAITVNRPPTANAGTDITAECSSHTTTPVLLNGTASSDPDGDTLTFTWSAPGVTFDNNHSATPTGQFPEGTTTVTLTVSDGIQQDTDTMTVTIVDTTPPVIACPSNITVECTGNLGVEATDPQLAPFFGGVSATDVCDPNPAITNNAPAFFGLGTTPVVFTATDDHGNASSCTATVTVVDTHPPEITVTVTPTSLWPPNHKMIAINATVTVTDECDPNPTFTLTSITSNEPDNGLGDGDQPNDIQGASYGTADTSFLLRAERSGKGTGRVYTITYTGKDSSNNTATATATVVVQHP